MRDLTLSTIGIVVTSCVGEGTFITAAGDPPQFGQIDGGIHTIKIEANIRIDDFKEDIGLEYASEIFKVNSFHRLVPDSVFEELEKAQSLEELLTSKSETIRHLALLFKGLK